MKRTTRWLALALSLVMVVCQFAIFATAETTTASEIVVYAKDADGNQTSAFTKTGSWGHGSYKVDEHATFYTKGAATFSFNMGTVPAGRWQVYYYSFKNTGVTPLSIKADGETVAEGTLAALANSTDIVDGWAKIGEITLAEAKKVTIDYSGSDKNVRPGAVKLIPVAEDPEGTVTAYLFDAEGNVEDNVTLTPAEVKDYSSSNTAIGWTWSVNTLTGGRKTASTRAKDAGFDVLFDGAQLKKGTYQVLYFNYAQHNAATPEMSLTVKEGERAAATVVKPAVNTTGNQNIKIEEWSVCGEVVLNGGEDVTVSFVNSNAAQNVRATAVKLIPVDVEDNSITVYADEEGFTGTGKWRDSSKSVNGHATVYSSNGSAAGFTFNMGTVPTGDYEVYYYCFADSAAMELQVNIKNSTAFTKTVKAISAGEADAGWVKLGEVELAVNNTVSVVYASTSVQNARATAVKLVPVTGQEPEGTMVVYTDSKGFTKMGNWGASSYAVDGHESYYLYNGSNMSGSFTFDFGTVQPDTYEVFYYSFYNTSTMTLEVSVGDEVQFEKGLVAVEDDPAALGWASLGRVKLETADTVAVSLPTTTTGHVRASAAKLVPVDEVNDPAPIEGGVTVYACENGAVNEAQVDLFPKTVLDYTDNAMRVGWVYGDLKVDGHDTLVTMLQGAKCSFTFDQSALTPGTYKVYYYASRVVPEMTFSVRESDSLIGKVFKDAIYSTTSNANIGAAPEWVDCGDITVMGVGDVTFDYQTGSSPVDASNARATAMKLVPVAAAEPETPAECPEGMYLDNFVYSGDWQATTVPAGPLSDYPTTLWIDKATIDASKVPAYINNYCQYTPQIESRTAKVYVWLNAWPYGQADQTVWEVHSGEEVQTFTIDMTTVNESGWYQLGTESFAFSADAEKNFVRLVCTDADNYGADTTFRASTVRFDLDPLEDGSTEIHDYYLTRYVSPNPDNKDRTHEELGALSDIEGDPIYNDIFYMYNEGFVTGATETAFEPNANVTESDFLTYLGNVLTKYGVAYTTEQLSAGVHFADEDETLTKEELALVLNNAFTLLDKHTEWLSALNVDYSAIKDLEDISEAAIDAVDLLYRTGIYAVDSEGYLLPGKTMTRAEATLVLKDFTQQFVQSSPTVSEEDGWVMTFNDEFQGTELNYDVWSSSDQDFGNLLGSRHPENVEVHDGAAHLVTKYESRYPGKYWTTADIFADKVFAQEYGYWECRYKIAAAPNTNNSFWCMSPSGTPNENRYEVDINEGQYPNSIANTFHEYKTNNGALYSQSKWTRSAYDLSQDYHTYACKWDAEHIYYYFDGKLTHTVNTTCGGSQSWPRLSTAILNRTSIKINPEEHDGTAMVVDYVRIWQRTDDLEAHTSVKNGALDQDGTPESLKEYLANQDPCAKGHTEETIAGKAATCTETGLTEGKKCTVCGVTTVEQETIEALKHAYDNGVITTAPTLNSEGVKTFTCANCGDTYTETVAKLEGGVAKIGETKFATLAEAFEAAKEGDVIIALEKIVVNGTETWDLSGKSVKLAAVADYALVVKGDLTIEGGEIYAMGEYGIGVNANGKLTVNGGTIATLNGMNAYLIGNYGTTVINSGNFAGEYMAVNNFDGTTVINGGDFYTAPWDENNPYYTFPYDVYALEGLTIYGGTFSKDFGEDSEKFIAAGYCCSEKDGKYVVAEHRWGNLAVTSATCTEDGYITITCGNCGKVAVSGKDAEADQYLKDYPFFQLGAKGHDFTILEAKDATCTETGLTEGKDCSRCDIEDVAQEEIPAKGHNYAANAEMKLACAGCDDVIEVTKAGIKNVNGVNYMFNADSTLANGVFADWSASYTNLYIIAGRPATSGVYTIDGVATYIGQNNKPVSGKVLLKGDVATAMGVAADTYYLLKDGQLVDNDFGDWSTTYTDLFFIKGRPAPAGVYTYEGAPIYVNSSNKGANGIVKATAEMAEAFGITAGVNYLFADGKLANNVFATWGGYEDLYIVDGRPAAEGVYTYEGAPIYIRYNKAAEGVILVNDADLAEAFGIETGKYYKFEDGVLFTGTGYWNAKYTNIAIVNGRPA